MVTNLTVYPSCLCLCFFRFGVKYYNIWIWNDIGRNCLLWHWQKIAKFLMRTFTCRSTFLYALCCDYHCHRVEKCPRKNKYSRVVGSGQQVKRMGHGVTTRPGTCKLRDDFSCLKICQHRQQQLDLSEAPTWAALRPSRQYGLSGQAVRTAHHSNVQGTPVGTLSTS